MPLNEQEPTETGQFALACERMNEFARTFRDSCRFETVRTSADIRYYENGWRLEKWVEAELNKGEGLCVAWWLELGPYERGWIVETHIAISPDIFFAGLEERTATSVQELRQQLIFVVDKLKKALDQDKQFADEVQKWMR
jgi:hypothetical protein